jgi:hypothetical protein
MQVSVDLSSAQFGRLTALLHLFKRCPTGFKGDYCEEATATSGLRPCEFKIRLLNTGAYFARFVLYYFYG